MSKLQGKIAVVTGASKGIGAGIAKALGAAGASVVVNYAGDKAGADKTVADIKAKGGKALAVQGDVSKYADVKHLFDETRKAYGKLDVLVNNAGVFKFLPLEETSEAEYQRQFGINVLGPLLATREALPLFGPEGGSVINISSIVSNKGIPGSAIYAGTKGALDTITLVMASELGPRKIRVNAIIRAWWKAKAPTRPVSSAAISRRVSKPRRRWAASASRKTSPRSRSSWPATSRAG